MQENKILSPFKMQVLQNFPYIEADFDALTNYGLLCKIVEYLNKIIEQQNITSENVNVLLNWFNNLDVQDEIDKKLDKMAQDGTMTQIVKNYVDPIYKAYETRINNNIIDISNEIDDLRDEIESVATGSPAGTYQTLNELRSASPDHSKIYVVNDDGNWYYYSTTSTDWLSGGLYQASVSSEDINTLREKVDNLTGDSRNLIDSKNIQLTPSSSSSREKFYDIHSYNLIANKTYTLSFLTVNTVPSSSSNNNLVARYRIGTSTGSMISLPVQQIENNKRYEFTFTPTDLVYSLSFVISSSASEETIVNIVELQIEENSKFTEYVPHKTAGDLESRARIKDIEEEINQSYKVSTYQELIYALENYNNIILLNDITITESIVINKNIILNGNGYKLQSNGITNYMISFQNKNAVINNVYFYGENTLNYLIACNQYSNVTFNNCKMHIAHDSVIRCVNNSYVRFYNCDVGYSYTNDGISPAGDSYVYIYNSTVHDCYDEGISSHNSSYVEVHNCESYNNGYIIGTKQKGSSSSFGGIHLGGGRMGIVESCYSHDNCTYGISLINFQDDTKNDVELCYNNIVKNNSGTGIFLTGCRDLTLSNNTIYNNGGAIRFGLDSTYTPTISLKASSGLVNKNTLYNNINNNIIIDPDCDDGIVILN